MIHALWNAVNADGPERMREWLADDYVRHDANHEFTRDQWIETLAARYQAFPDNISTVVEVIEEGDKLAYRWEAFGTHEAQYEGVPPTGRQVHVQGITISRLHDGKIVEEWASWNKSSVLRSLGVLPIA